MSKKIVIDKEVFEQKIKGWIERRTYVRSSDVLDILNDHLTEIDTDQNIEGRAEKKYHDAIVTINLAKKLRYIEGATEQDLISKAREGEFAKWCSTNKFIYSNNEKAWYHKNFANFISKHCNVWYTTEELFNQFTNR